MKALLFLLLALPIQAQVLGAYETFTKEENATSWGVYDFGTDEVYSAFHFTDGATAADIYTSFTEDASLVIFADELTSSQYFIGDYAAAGIDVISCDIYIEDYDSLGQVEFYIHADGVEYYGPFLEIDSSGWSEQSVSFQKDQWYAYDTATDSEVPVTITAAILSEVTEIGLFFTPSSTEADQKIIAIDNFGLFPDLTAPSPTLTKSATGMTIAFQQSAGISYDLQTSQTLAPDSWGTLSEVNSLDLRGEGTWEADMTTLQRAFFQITTYALTVETP